MSKVLVIGVLPESLLNFRGDLIKAVVASGHDVVAMSEPTDGEMSFNIERLGAKHHGYPVQRNGMSPRSDLATLFALWRAIKKERPDIILAYTIKPVVWGGLANLLCGHARFYALIEGLGYAFQGGGFKRLLLKATVKALYRVPLFKASSVIFLNPDNRELFVRNKIVRRDKCCLVDGCGVDVKHFGLVDLPSSGAVVFLCVARLLGEKGLREYVAAARIVRQQYPDTSFRLLGPRDPSPDGIPEEEVQDWHTSGQVDYYGSATDVRPFLKDCHVYVLPSYHEGLPRTVIEAMATGRPIITTDAPGCRETVTDGDNGYLVPVRNAERLAEAMCRFIEQPELIQTMGRRSRAIAERKYDVHRINEVMLREMGLLKSQER